LAHLDLEVIQAGDGKLFVDPRDAFADVTPDFVASFPDFVASLELAFKAAQQKLLFTQPCSGRYRVRFEVRPTDRPLEGDRPLQRPSGIDGLSAGGAAVCGWWHALNGTIPDQEIVVLARLKSVDNGFVLDGVRGVEAKVNAIIEAGRYDTIVVACEEDDHEVKAALKNKTLSDIRVENLGRATEGAEGPRADNLDRLLRVRSHLVEELKKYYEELIQVLNPTPWMRKGRPVRVMDISVGRKLRQVSEYTEEREDDEVDAGDREAEPAPRTETKLVAWDQLYPRLRRAVVLGASGAGKSFLLKAAAIGEAQQGLLNLKERRTLTDACPLPLFMDPDTKELPDSAESLAVSFQKGVRSRRCERWARAVILKAQCSIFMDAFDRMSDDKRTHLQCLISDLDDRGGQCRIVVTSTDEGQLPFKNSEYDAYRLEPLAWRLGTLSLIDRWFGEDYEGITTLRSILSRNPALRQACASPLIIALTCLAQEVGALTGGPTRSTDIYESVIRSLLRKVRESNWLDPRDPKIDLRLTLLKAAAFNLHRSNPNESSFTYEHLLDAIRGAGVLPMPLEVLSGSLNPGDEQYPELLTEELRRCGILVQVDSSTDQQARFKFIHDSFLDYLVGCQLAVLATTTGWAVVKEVLRLPQSSRTEPAGSIWGWRRLLTLLQRWWPSARPAVKQLPRSGSQDHWEVLHRVSPFLAGRLSAGGPLFEALLLLMEDGRSLAEQVLLADTLLNCLLEYKGDLPFGLKAQAFDTVLTQLDASQNRRGEKEWRNLGANLAVAEGVLAAAHRQYGAASLAEEVGDVILRIHGRTDELATSASEAPQEQKPPPLVNGVNRSPAAAVRWLALWGMAHLRHEGAARVVAGCLTDPSPAVRALSARALVAVPPTNAYSLLVPLKSDVHPHARAGWASAVGRLGDRQALRPLKQLTRPKQPDTVRSPAMWALKELARPEDRDLVEIFREGLHDARVRFHAAKGIAKSGGAECLPDLALWLVMPGRHPGTNLRMAAECWAATHRIISRSACGADRLRQLSRHWSGEERDRALTGLSAYLRARRYGSYWDFTKWQPDSERSQSYEVDTNSKLEDNMNTADNWNALADWLVEQCEQSRELTREQIWAIVNMAKFVKILPWKKRAWTALKKRLDVLMNAAKKDGSLAEALASAVQWLPGPAADDPPDNLVSFFDSLSKHTLVWYALSQLTRQKAYLARPQGVYEEADTEEDEQEQRTRSLATESVPAAAEQNTQERGDGSGRILAPAVESHRPG
jgi:HEAT repeat protein